MKSQYLVLVTPELQRSEHLTLHFRIRIKVNYVKILIEQGNETVEENLERSEEHNSPRGSIVPPPNASLTMYLKSIIYMPNSIRILCLTNLFSWMAHVCYSLYFTDFVGEAVFQGNPTVGIINNYIGIGTKVQ